MMDLFLRNTQLFSSEVVWISGCIYETSIPNLLQTIHWWASDVMLNLSKSDQIKKRTHFGWSEGKYIFSYFSFLWTFFY